MKHELCALSLMSLFSLGVAACSATGDSDSEQEAAGKSSGAGGAGGATSGTGGDSMSVGGGSLGAGAGSDGGMKGCNYVDVLFVIDNSTSMGDNQEKLAGKFPDFIDAMVNNLPPATDLHVGITTSSFDTLGSGSPGEVNCQSMGTVPEFLQHYHTPDEGNDGENGGQGRLFTWDGKSYFAADTSADTAALKSWFAGAATAVGETGSVWEMVAAGGAYIAHPDNAASNTGFIRDEGAVLVVFFLTDEVDNSPESAAAYHDLLVSSKTKCGGDACIVAGGLIPPCISMTPGNTLWGLMSSFGEMPKFADIEGPETEYTTVLGEALAQVIALTCEEIPSSPK